MLAATLALILVALTFGAFSSLLFAWQWLFGAPGRITASIVLVVVCVAALQLFRYLRTRVPPLRLHYHEHRIYFGVLFAGTVAAFSYAAYWIVRKVESVPHGGWDAIAIWNAHARFLHRGSGAVWKDLFTKGWSNPDYPLLLPGLTSGAWTIAGADRAATPAVLAIAFGVVTVGVLGTAISALTKDERGWVAALLLVATPSFLREATQQTADTPLGLYILTTVVLLQLADAWPSTRREMLLLAGLSAGFAAWTKNEGLLFLVALLGSYLAGHAVLGAWGALRNNVWRIGVGLAPMLLLVLSFKAFLAPNNSVVSAEVLNLTLDRGIASERYLQIISGFLGEARSFGGAWDGGIHPFVLLTLFLLLYAARPKTISPTSLGMLLLVGFMLAGYFVVYMISPFGAGGFLRGSLGRLLIQLWPAGIFIVATVFRAETAVQSTTLPAQR